MKNKIWTLLIVGVLLSGCASVVKYEDGNHDRGSAERGTIKVALGANQNVHVNDKLYVLERKCVGAPRVPICDFEPIGTLTVKEVKETYSLVQPDVDIVFREGYYFKFAMHCEGNAKACK